MCLYKKDFKILNTNIYLQKSAQMYMYNKNVSL